MDTGSNPEQALEHEKEAHYEASIPDAAKRATLESAKVKGPVKELLWMHKGLVPDAEGNLSEAQQLQARESIGKVILALEVDPLNESDLSDPEKILQWQEKTDKTQKAREVFQELLEETFGSKEDTLDEEPVGTDPSEQSPPQEKTAEEVVEEFLADENDTDKDREDRDKLTQGALLLSKDVITADDIRNAKEHFKGLTREQVELHVAMSNLNSEQKEEFLQSFEPMPEEEQKYDQETAQRQNDMIREAIAAATSEIGRIETSDADESEKRTASAKFRALSKRLDEMKVKKYAKGFGKAAAISVLLVLLLLIWELQLVGKMSKKR